MTYNPCAGMAVQRIRKYLPENPNVIELGSQTLTFKVPGHDLKDTPDYYKLLGFREYDAIDTDGHGTIDLDLNKVHQLKQRDLVTNSGTGEHIFNQAAVFETVHNLCKPGGVMLHILPWINWRNHGFYNFNPILFYDLAYENGYEVLEMSRADRNGNGLETVSFEEIKKPDPTDVNWFVIAALKKTNNEPFKVPTQRKYRRETKPAPKEWQFGILDGLKVETDPFPHVVGKLNPDLYKLLEKEWPTAPKLFSGTIKGQNTLRQLNAAVSLMHSPRVITPLWDSFVQHHTSKAFLQEVFKLFAPYIQQAYPHLLKKPLESCIRGLDKAPFMMDCQLAINTPVTRKSSVRGAHVDSPTELIGGLLYMPVEGDTAGGDLKLGTWKKGKKFVERRGMWRMSECDPKAVKLTKTIKYEPGSFVFFLNTLDAVHAVTERSKTNNLRRYVNFLIETPDPLFGFDVRKVSTKAVQKEWAA